jgi:Domain of unknown function (DUF5134)
MTGPTWLVPAFAALMLAIAACCAIRLAMWRLHGRGIEPDADGVHVLMGVAMAGMLEPRLSPVPATAWQAVFAAAAAWFTWRAIRASRRPQPGRLHCAHPAPHAVECAAMIYMLLPAHPASMSMPMTSGPAANPAFAMVLALFMLGYVLWTTDQLATLSRAGTADGLRAIAGATSTSTSEGSGRATALRLNRASTAPAGAVAASLAPRLAACYKIAMSVAMGYMLITML